MRYQLIWQVGLIIFVVGIMSIGLGAKGCSSADTSDLITGSSGYITQPFPIPDFTLAPDRDLLWYGGQISTGDFNGDGLDDLVVAAEWYNVFVYYGSISGLSTTPDWVGESNQELDRYAYSLGDGDFNGDGFDDLAVGADKHSNGETKEGMVFVYHGSASGLSATPNWTGESNQAEAFYGSSIDEGDFNGDGFLDLAVGARNYGSAADGKVFVYHGSASGLSATPNWTDELNKSGARCRSGHPGDFDGDGFDDLVITTYYSNYIYDRIFIYHGSITGLSTTAKVTITSYGGSRGDINNDGFDDLVEGVQTGPTVAMLRVSYGSASGLSTPSTLPISYQECSFISPGGLCDFNNDGFRDLIIIGGSATNDQGQEGMVWIHLGSASGFSLTFTWTGESNQSVSGYGGCTVGDYNGDGVIDLAIGAESYNGYNGSVKDRDRVGRVFIYYDVVGE